MIADDARRGVAPVTVPRPAPLAEPTVAGSGAPATADRVARSFQPVIRSVAVPAPTAVPAPPSPSLLSRLPSIVVRVGAPRIAPLLAVLPDRSRHRRSMPRPIRSFGPAAAVGTAEPDGQRA